MYYMVIELSSVQLNIRTSPILLDEIDTIVNKGLFRNRTEAVNEAIRLLIRRYKVMKIAEKIENIANQNLGNGSLTQALLDAREEEDDEL